MAATAARLDASSAPRLAGMNADAKLATREKVSTVSAPIALIGVPLARRITQASSAMKRYDATAAVSRTARRFGLPRTRSSICRSTAATWSAGWSRAQPSARERAPKYLDRFRDGLVSDFTIAENLILGQHWDETWRSGPFLDDAATTKNAEAAISSYSIMASGPDMPCGRLSGGNAQKVVLARELSRDLRLFVAAQPTRGVDVGSIEFIHKRVIETRDAGVPVIVVSTELDEVTALADRIMVMYRGRVVGIVPGDTSRDVLGLMMAGEAPQNEGVAA